MTPPTYSHWTRANQSSYWPESVWDALLEPWESEVQDEFRQGDRVMLYGCAGSVVRTSAAPYKNIKYWVLLDSGLYCAPLTELSRIEASLPK